MSFKISFHWLFYWLSQTAWKIAPRCRIALIIVYIFTLHQLFVAYTRVIEIYDIYRIYVYIICGWIIHFMHFHELYISSISVPALTVRKILPFRGFQPWACSLMILSRNFTFQLNIWMPNVSGLQQWNACNVVYLKFKIVMTFVETTGTFMFTCNFGFRQFSILSNVITLVNFKWFCNRMKDIYQDQKQILFSHILNIAAVYHSKVHIFGQQTFIFEK